MGAARSFLTFDTAIGPCAVAWSERGLTHVRLPGVDVESTVASLVAEAGDVVQAEPPDWVRAATERIVEHLGGAQRDFSDVALDLDAAPPFRRKVYEAARKVPAGRTITYGELARSVGSPGAARAVGQAMATNPLPIVIPCHRVTAANGEPGGFSAYGGLFTKSRLLALEGVALEAGEAAPRASGSEDAGVRAAIAVLSMKDRPLGRLIERAGPFRLAVERGGTTFGALARSIIYQQLHARAAHAIASRVAALGPATLGPAASMVEAPPAPGDLTGRSLVLPGPGVILAAKEDALRGAGLSRSKIAALRDLAERTERGEVPPFEALAAMDDEVIIEKLTAVRGIGRWTVEMLLIFWLGRPDVLPTGDYGVRKGFARAFPRALRAGAELPSPADVARRGERWRPHRTIASWYLWRANEVF